MTREDWERKAEAVNLLEQAKSVLEDMLSDLEERISNIEEYFSSSPVLDQLSCRRDTVENAIYSIDDAISELESME